MRYTLLSLFLVGGTVARPSPDIKQRAAADPVSSLNQLPTSAAGTSAQSSALTILQSAKPTATPANVDEAASKLQAIYQASPTPKNLYAALADMVEAGLTPNDAQSALNYVIGALTGQNSDTNLNLRIPIPLAYPKANSSDAPYSLTEAQLRAAIYIPPTFQYGAGNKQPVILVPGTGGTGYLSFAGNFIPLLRNSPIADIVWLNIPKYLLNDVQSNAEYVAYAINYIYGISNHKPVATIAWSQGNLDVQWALKYWPSARGRVTDHIAISPDYDGTILANFISLGEPLPPAILQQNYNSKLIQALHTNNGDSAYVPTTVIYSASDEIVQPQSGTGASAYLLDTRNLGVTNSEVQVVCAGHPAGGFYTHEGVMYNPLTYALAIDALTHDGPGRTERLDLSVVCASYLAQGLDLTDFVNTENTILVSGVATLVYQPKVVSEPAIRGYA